MELTMNKAHIVKKDNNEFEILFSSASVEGSVKVMELDEFDFSNPHLINVTEVEKQRVVQEQAVDEEGNPMFTQVEETVMDEELETESTITIDEPVMLGVVETYTDYELSVDEDKLELRNEQLLQDKLDAIRVKRDLLLIESDKFMLSDFPISEEDLILVKACRQELRDLPENIDDVDNFSWPELVRL